MSAYMSRLFAKSNSSFLLRSGNALQAKVARLREEMYLIDAGVGPPKIATRDELIGAPKSDGPAHFSNRVGFLNPSNADTPIRNQILERCFVDLVTGDPRTKERAAVRFTDLVGQNDAVGGGEQPLVLPRSFRKLRAWMELKTKWRTQAKVKGFLVQGRVRKVMADRVRTGYAVAIGGYVAFLPSHTVVSRRFMGDRFLIESMNDRNFEITVTKAW